MLTILVLYITKRLLHWTLFNQSYDILQLAHVLYMFQAHDKQLILALSTSTISTHYHLFDSVRQNDIIDYVSCALN